jgi:hypothetical protein
VPQGERESESEPANERERASEREERGSTRARVCVCVCERERERERERARQRAGESERRVIFYTIAGTPIVNALFAQRNCLVNIMRACVGQYLYFCTSKASTFVPAKHEVDRPLTLSLSCH